MRLDTGLRFTSVRERPNSSIPALWELDDSKLEAWLSPMDKGFVFRARVVREDRFVMGLFLGLTFGCWAFLIDPLNLN